MAHPDLNNLLNDLLGHAQDLLDEQDGFYPFAAVMSVSGEVTEVAAYDGEEHPDPDEVIDQIQGVLRSMATGAMIRACGYCVDVAVSEADDVEPTDAVRATLEHLSGEACHVFLPYEKTDEGEYAYGELFATEADVEVFGAS